MTRAKRRFNWILIGSLLGVVVLLGVALRIVHDWQMQAHAQAIRSQVEQAEQEKRLGDAIDALRRYLALNPGHQESLAKLGTVLDQTADSPAGWSRALIVNERVLKKDVANQALRRRVAELAIKVGDLQLAYEHLSQLTRTAPEDGELAARLGDVLLMAGRPSDAVSVFQDSIKAQPNQTLAYSRLARVYLTRLNQPVLAEQAIEQMIKAQPENAAAYLQRGYFYRLTGRVDDALKDFQHAIELDSSNAAPLVALTKLALTQGRYDEARQLLDRGAAQHPSHLVWYRDAAELDLLEGHPDKALAWIERGLKLAPEDPDLWHFRIEAGKQKKDFASARKDLEQLRKLPQAPRGLADFLEARILLQEGATLKARERLQGLQADRTIGAWLRARVALSLAEAEGVLGQPGQQLVELRRAIALDPSLKKASVLLGQMLLAQGRTDEARSHLLEVSQGAEPPLETYAALARASLLYNLGQPDVDRNWNETLRALQSIEQVPDYAVEAMLIRADVLVAQGKEKDAAGVLAEGTSRHPDSARLWTARVALARREGDLALARSIEAAALKSVKDPTLLRLGTLEAGTQATANELRAAQEELLNRLDSYPLAQQIAILQALGRHDPEGAARRLADRKPATGMSLIPALELALLGRDAELVQKIVESLREVEGTNSPAASFGQAAWNVRLARRLRTDLLTEARPVLEAVAKERPTWAAPHAWLGRLELQLGRSADAVREFLQAFDLGDRNPALCLQLLDLLVENNDLDQADRIFRRMERVLLPTGEMARVGAQIAQMRSEFARAVRLAEQARPAGPSNPGYLLWRASLLGKVNELPEAILNVREAMRLAPVDPDGWVLWVELLVKSGRSTDIDSVLAQLRERQPVDLQAVTLAQCEAVRGDDRAAAGYFEQALRRDSRDVYALWKAAQFYVGIKNAAAARPLLEQLRRQAPNLTDERSRWVEQQLTALAGN